MHRNRQRTALDPFEHHREDGEADQNARLPSSIRRRSHADARRDNRQQVRDESGGHQQRMRTNIPRQSQIGRIYGAEQA